MDNDDKDELFVKALIEIMQNGKASAPFLQRRLSIGYPRAARIMDQLEAEGFVRYNKEKHESEIIVNGANVRKKENLKDIERLSNLARENKIKEWYKTESEKYKDYDQETLFPWPDVGICFAQEVSKRVFRSSDDFRNDPNNRYIWCPKCKKGIQDLGVIYFDSPNWTLENDEWGRSGWLVICVDCKKQVHFEVETDG